MGKGRREEGSQVPTYCDPGGFLACLLFILEAFLSKYLERNFEQ